MNADLERMTVPPTDADPGDDLLADDPGDVLLAGACAASLGYTKLRDELTAAKMRRRVLGILKRVGILPFAERSVASYKEKKARLIVPLWFLCLSSSTLLGIVITAPLLAVLLDDISFLCLWVLILCWAMLGGMLFDAIHVPTGRWVATPLQNVEIPVPEFALQTALDVRTALDEEQIGHSFMVEALTRQTIDPFLVLKVGSLDFYLEIWNEPDFKVRRTD